MSGRLVVVVALEFVWKCRLAEPDVTAEEAVALEVIVAVDLIGTGTF